MIPKSFIQDLLNRLDIVDVIERYVPLKKAGANYVACCPFHNEKSPSFTVSQSKQFYHCFGCGVHGTAIGFVMEHAGLGFVEAVEELAKSIGVEVPREASNLPHHKVAPDLYELMQSVTRYYREQLKRTSHAIDYLKQRGLTGEVAARFGIGYAPDGWQNLASAVPDYQDASLVETGLVIESDEGKRYDRFRDRIMFPIINVRGQVIGFGGRVLDKGEHPHNKVRQSVTSRRLDGIDTGGRREVTGTSGSTSAQPKYLNSPETPLFEKGHELYGLFQAQKAIRAHQRVVVVEGYMDVVALAQHGVEYAVATLGTATTPFHVQKLLRLSEQIVFCFDGDKAGQKAAWRALENALPQLVDGKRIGFLFLPEEHDPDTYIREFGTEAFEQLLEDSLTLSGYLLRELTAQVDLHTQEGRSALLQKAQPLLTEITAPMTALLLRKEVAGLAGVTQAELESLYSIKPISPSHRSAPQKVVRTTPSGLHALLRCLLAKPELARAFPREVLSDSAEAVTIRALIEWVQEQQEEVSVAAMTQSFQGTSHEAALAAVQAEVMQWGENFDVDAEFHGVQSKLREEALKQEFHLLHGRADTLSEAEQERFKQLLTEMKQQRG